MQQQSESAQPTLHMLTLARARAASLANALWDAQPPWGQARALELERALALAWERGRELALALAQAQAQVQAEVQTLALELELERAQERDQAALALALERAQAQEWALAQARARALVLVQTRALVQTERMFTYGEALADSELIDIIYSFEPELCHRLARDIWHQSRHWWLIQIIAPITRLPQELLHQILLIIINNASDSPLVLMRVSKYWYTIVTGIWASLKLGTTTPRDTVTRILQRAQWLLDVVVDTELDRDLTPFQGAYQAIFAAMEATSRWRRLLVESLPTQADLPEYLVTSGLQKYSDAEMTRLRTFIIKCPCEMSPLLERLLRILGTTASRELTIMEIHSPSVISFLAPTYPSIFHSIKVLSLDTPRLPNPVDFLPHLHQLEVLTASHLSLPIYHNDVDIPFVHTLRHLSLRAVSIQWMSGRTFHALESCTLHFPLHRHVLQTFSATLPNCNKLIFQAYPLDILVNGVSTQNLTHLTVNCPCSEKLRGSRQLVRFSSHALQETRPALRILHINIEATSKAWIKALSFMSNLEELVIDNSQPSSLGVKALQALVVHPVHASNLGTTNTPGGGHTPVCPSLKRFGLRYRRWLRPTEHFDLIPELVSIIWSRGQSNFALQSFRIWKESDQEDPLELIEGSGISLEGFERLANVGGWDVAQLVTGRLVEKMFKPCPHRVL